MFKLRRDELMSKPFITQFIAATMLPPFPPKKNNYIETLVYFI